MLGSAAHPKGHQKNVHIKLILDDGGSRSEFFLKALKGETILDVLKRELGHRIRIRRNALGEWIEAIDGVREREAAGWQGYIRGENGLFGLPYFDTPSGPIFPGLGKIRIGKPIELLLRFDEGVSADIVACPESPPYFEGFVWTCKLRAFDELQAARARALARMLAHPTMRSAGFAGRDIRLVMERAQANAMKRLEEARGLWLSQAETGGVVAEAQGAREVVGRAGWRWAFAENARQLTEHANGKTGARARTLFANIRPLKEEIAEERDARGVVAVGKLEVGGVWQKVANAAAVGASEMSGAREEGKVWEGVGKLEVGGVWQKVA
ncbi:MAG: hypothetical protein QXG98_03715, partial [Candidatus Micrarchaeia archaeon]